MAKLPDKESLGGLPNVSVPGGLPRANMSAVGEGYRDLGRGLQSLSNSLEAQFKEQEDLASVGPKADFSIGLDKDLTDAKLSPDYENAPEAFKKSAYKRLEDVKRNMSPKEALKFDAAARVRIEGYYTDLHANRDKSRRQAANAEDDVRLDEFTALGAKAMDDPDNPNYNYYDEKKREGLAVIDARAKQFKTPIKEHNKRRRAFMEGMDAFTIKTIAARDPAQALRILETFKLNPDAGEPDEDVPVGKFDRSSYRQEIEASPELRERLRHIVYGEVGRGASRDKKLIQLETIFNRAAARGQTIEQVTRNADLQKDGYYPTTTFVNGRRASQNAPEDFDNDLLEPVLGGSDRSTELLGFPSTGNASQGVAARGVASGRYRQYGSLDGQHGAPGVETYVSGHGSDNIERLNSTRVAETTEASAKSKSPGVMVSDSGMTLRPNTYLQLQKAIEQQAKNRAADERRERLLVREEAKAASDQAEMKYYDRITRKDSTVKLEDVFADRPDNPLDAAARLRVKRFYEHDSKPEPDARISARAAKGLWTDIDSGKITDAGPILDAYAPANDPMSGSLTKSDRDDLLKHLGNKLTNKDDPLERQIKQMSDAFKSTFRKNPVLPDPLGDPQHFRWEQALRKKIQEYRNPPTGPDGKPGPKKDPSVLLDPESKEYFGAPKVLQEYKRSFQEITRDVRESMRARPLSGNTPQPTDEQRRKPDESADDYLKRRGL